jgi:hypothetical protein
MSAEAVSASTEFDIFAIKPVQTSTLDMIETVYKLIASIDQSDLEFLIPADCDTYIDLKILLLNRGKLIKAVETELDSTDYTSVINNLLHSLFGHWNITLKDVTITPTAGLDPFCAYLGTLLT